MTNQVIPLHVVFVEAWIKDGDKYLLAKRSSKDDQAAGKWAVPGGKVDMELEDDIIGNSLAREVMEEVGVTVANPRFITSDAFIRSSGHHVIRLSFLLEYVSGDAKPLEDQDEIRWVRFDNLKDMLDEYNYGVIDKLMI